MHVPISFLGTGLMGFPMALNLLKAGYPLTAWNRTSAKALPLTGHGARVVKDPRDAVSGASIICLMLENGAVVSDVLFSQGVADRLAEGAVVIDLSSIAPWMAKQFSERLAERNVTYLDAPVSGGPYGAADGTLAVMVGGDEPSVDRVRDVLKVFGTATHVGPSGTGQIAKLGSQMIVASAIGAIAEALILARSNGADPAKVREALSGGFADSKILQIHAKRMLGRDFVPGGHIRTHSKDLDAAIKVAESSQLKLPLSNLVHEVFQDLCRRGLGDYDHAALILALEEDNKPHRLSDGPIIAPKVSVDIS